MRFRSRSALNTFFILLTVQTWLERISVLKWRIIFRKLFFEVVELFQKFLIGYLTGRKLKIHGSVDRREIVVEAVENIINSSQCFLIFRYLIRQEERKKLVEKNFYDFSSFRGNSFFNFRFHSISRSDCQYLLFDHVPVRYVLQSIINSYLVVLSFSRT